MEIDLSCFSLQKLQLFDNKLLYAIECVENKKHKNRPDYHQLTRLIFLRHHVRDYLKKRENGEIDLVNNIVKYGTRCL